MVKIALEEFIWDYGSRVLRIHPGGEAWQQVAGMGEEEEETKSSGFL